MKTFTTFAYQQNPHVMKELKIEIQMQTCTYDELPDEERKLMDAACEATNRSYAPYSHFSVGAAALLENGTVVTGTNQENAAYPSGICAERSVLYYAEAIHASDPIVALAIASDPSERECYPCGACRQVILDVQRRQGTPIRLIMSGNGTASIVDNAEALLPFTFQL